MNELYENFLFMINQDDKVEFKKAGIECMACLWEKKPLLALRCRDIVDNFINSDDYELHNQIIKVFYNILFDYHENHQKFYEKLRLNFNSKVGGANDKAKSKKKATPQEEATEMKVENPHKSLNDITSVIQLISENSSKAIQNIYHYDQDTKLVVLRVILLLIKEGHCHVHTIFKRVFALVSDSNDQIRSLAIDIIQEALYKNASIISLELENAIVETKQVFGNNNSSNSLYFDATKKRLTEGQQSSSDQQISVYDIIYKGFLDCQQQKDLKLRGLVDAGCALVMTMGNNYEMITFISEMMISLTKVHTSDYIKWISCLDNFIQKRYQKIRMMMKPLVKEIGSQEIDINQEEAEEDSKAFQGGNKFSEMIEKNGNQIFSLLIAEIYLFFTLKLTRDGESGKGLFLLDEEENLSECVDMVKRKLQHGEDSVSQIKLNMQKDVMEAITITLSAYLDVTSYTNPQNFKDLYQILKSVYKINNDCLDMFEGIGPDCNMGSSDKNTDSTKTKKRQKKKKVVKKAPSSINKISRHNKTSMKKKGGSKAADSQRYASKGKSKSQKVKGSDEDFTWEYAKKNRDDIDSGKASKDKKWNSRLRKRKTATFKDPMMSPTKQIELL